MFGQFKVLGGDFKTGDGKGQFTFGTLSLYDLKKHSFTADTKYQESQIRSVEPQLQKGGKMTFVCRLSDGRKFIGEAEVDIYQRLLVAALANG